MKKGGAEAGGAEAPGARGALHHVKQVLLALAVAVLTLVGGCFLTIQVLFGDQFADFDASVAAGTPVVEALERYAAREGAYPQTLAELVPKDLASIPPTGEAAPVRSRRIDMAGGETGPRYKPTEDRRGFQLITFGSGREMVWTCGGVAPNCERDGWGNLERQGRWYWTRD